MIRLHIVYNNRIEYMIFNSLWAANYIASELISHDKKIAKIHITDKKTGELYRTYNS